MSVAVEPLPARITLTLEARDLWHRYAPGRGLAPISFAVASPGAIAVTGPNGSGKSTLLRIVAGLLRPSGGLLSVAQNGHGVVPASRRGWVGFAAPELMFYEELTVSENLRFASEARGMGSASATAVRALERVGLSGRAEERVAALSSGMRQRLRIAFAVLGDSPLLLLDEPGSHLDAEGQAMLATLIDERRRDGLVLIATNDEREWTLAEQRIELRGSLGDPS